jgi:hypothetical protein
MSDDLRTDLSDRLEEWAGRVPVAAPPTAQLVRSGRRAVARRRTVSIAVAAGLLVAAGGGLTALALSGEHHTLLVTAPYRTPITGAAHSGAATAGPTAGVIGEPDCVEAYSPAAVRQRGFAFDGVVTAIGPSTFRDPGDASAEGPPPWAVPVTFAVKEWFAGGSGSTVTVDVPAPAAPGRPSNPDSLLSYSVGSRLLVSGEPRFGGSPLEQAIAWGCGFTRPYDAATAASWR